MAMTVPKITKGMQKSMLVKLYTGIKINPKIITIKEYKKLIQCSPIKLQITYGIIFKGFIK